MRTAFVTGGSGFVGRRLVARLVREGVAVRALVRRDAARQDLTALGAEPVRGDLTDPASLAAGLRGCDIVFHVAGHLAEWGEHRTFFEANVTGTASVIDAARAAGVPTLVAAGASAVVMGAPRPLRGATEDLPLQQPAWAPYIATKAEAERLVRAAADDRLRTVVVRPPLIWGEGMPMLDVMVEAVAAGRFALPDGGRQAMSTSHVDNVVEALLLAARNGRSGEAYFVADEDDSTLAKVTADLLATRGLPPVKRAVPFALAWPMAATLEMVWRTFRLRSQPPITRQTLRMIGQDFTISTDKARRELGYRPVMTRADGLRRMREASARR